MTRFESTSSYYWQWHQVTVLYFLSFSYHSSPNHSSSSATISFCAEKVHVSMDNCCACCHCWTRFLGVHLCYHTLLCIEKEKSQEARYIKKDLFGGILIGLKGPIVVSPKSKNVCATRCWGNGNLPPL